MGNNERIVDDGGQKRIGRQIVLPLRKAIEIAWKSIRIRIWRSLITTSGIVLAIAFLMSVWSSGALTERLREVPEDDPNYPVIQRALQREAVSQENISIRVGILGGQNIGQAENTMNLLFRDALQRRQEFNPFLMPESPDQLRQLLGTEDPNEAVESVIVLSIPPALANDETVEALETFVQTGGTLVTVGYGQLLPADASEAFRNRFMKLLPASPGGNTVSAEAENTEPADHASMADVKWDLQPEVTFVMAEPRQDAMALARVNDNGAFWLSSLGEGTVFWLPVSGEDLQRAEIARWMLEGRLINSALYWGARETFRGGSLAKRKLWLVSLSLLVCIVGITNAMLMSVTERFREIGTMKCLGALDRFVVRLFLIESSFQGAAGSILGALIGLLLAFGRTLFAYRVTNQVTGETHWLALDYFPVGNVLLWLVISVVVGIILSVVAAIYPAYRAARMEPVDAMRSEA